MSNRGDTATRPDYGIAPDGHRLPARTGLGAVRLQVSDLERSLDYYRRVLGFRLIRREGPDAALAAHGDDRVLIELRERVGAAPVPMHGRLGLYHFAILLPSRADLGRFLAHLSRGGVRFGASDHLVSEALYLHDPDGLGIEVYVDRPRSTWETADSELVMATIPLDRSGPLQAADDAPWTGMPAGTVMGHVHLHVGDLRAAAAFYHQALGFDMTVWSYPGALFLSAGGYHHHLGLNTWAAGAPPAGAEEAKLLEWTIELPGADEASDAAESLETAGYPIDRVTDGEVVALDPWGTRLRLRGARTTAGTEGRYGEAP